MHPSLGEGPVFKFAQMKGPPFSKGDNYEIAKILWRILKIFFFRTAESISTKFDTKQPWVKGIQIQMKNHSILIK